MTPHLEQRLQQIAEEKGYHPASEYMDALRTGAQKALEHSSAQNPKIIQLLLTANNYTLQSDLLGLADNGETYILGDGGVWTPCIPPICTSKEQSDERD